jgi:hypothetical protein
MKKNETGCDRNENLSPNPNDNLAAVSAKESPHHSKAVLDSVKHFEILPENALISPAAVALIRGHSMATYWRRVAEGTYPKPTRQFGRAVSNTVGEIRNLKR